MVLKLFLMFIYLLLNIENSQWLKFTFDILTSDGGIFLLLVDKNCVENADVASLRVRLAPWLGLPSLLILAGEDVATSAPLVEFLVLADESAGDGGALGCLAGPGDLSGALLRPGKARCHRPGGGGPLARRNLLVECVMRVLVLLLAPLAHIVARPSGRHCLCRCSSRGMPRVLSLEVL